MTNILTQWHCRCHLDKRMARVDIVRAAVQPASKKLTALQKHMVKLAATRGLWTEDRILECGMLSSTGGKRPLCGMRDGVFHRAWVCPAAEVAAARKKACHRWILDEALRPNNPFWTTGMFPHPQALDNSSENTITPARMNMC